ncbi:MAG TPA: hypothetical protein VHU90_01100, partial [Galbitalea sp.]|nr:hypothetical protein [Galbitalea sp.]
AVDAADNAANPGPTGPTVTSAQSTESLAQEQKAILQLFRTRRELIRWRDVDQYANLAQSGVDAIRDAAEQWGAAALIPTTQKAIASTVRAILRADDSNGVIGTVIDDLLQVHAELCVLAPPPTAKLVTWLIDFQFDGKQDYFNPDVAQYATALGERGLALFEEKVRALHAGFGEPPSDFDHNQHTVQFNLRRLAVARRDPDALISSFGPLTRAYVLHDLAKALVEIDAIDQALGHAERGAKIENGWQAERCALYWCELLDQNRAPAELRTARAFVFDTWPTSSNAVRLAGASGDGWSSIAEVTFDRLREGHPRELINTMPSLDLRDQAWKEAEGQRLDRELWSRLVASRQAEDPASVVPVLRELIDADLEVSDIQNYRSAVKRLRQLRDALRACDREDEFAPIIRTIQVEHRRRPRLMEELRKARLDR